jgi:photosystem II stability/assembly factor-like uncharacterized protein
MKKSILIIFCYVLIMSVSTRAQQNSAPVIKVPGAQNVAAGQPLIFDISATDPDTKQTLTFSAINMPSLASLNKTSATTAQFKWIPSGNQSGPYRVTFRVKDNGSTSLSDSSSVVISIRKNSPPVISGISTIAGSPTKEIKFSVSATDPDKGQILDFSATALPAGAVLRQRGGSMADFTWTPTGKQTGTHVINIEVKDKGTPALKDTHKVSIIIGNSTPDITIPSPQTVASGKQLKFVVNGSDADNGQILAINVSGLPSGATLRQISTERTEFSWTPRSEQIGVYNVTFSVKDNGLPIKSTSKTLKINVLRVGSWVKAKGVIPRYEGKLNVLTGLQVIENNLVAGNDSGVFISADNGDSWTPANNGLDDLNVSALAVSENKLFAGTKSGLYISTNSGQSWEKINNNLTNTVIVGLTAKGSVILARTESAVLLSTDSGVNWSQTYNKPGSTIDAAIDEGSLYLGQQPDLCRSTNNGQDWTCKPLGPLFPPLATPIIVNGNKIITGGCGTLPGSVISTDYGNSWSALSINPTGGICSYIKMGSDLLITSGITDEVFISTNFGLSWVLNEKSIKKISHFAARGNLVFAVTSSGELYKVTIYGSY